MAATAKIIDLRKLLAERFPHPAVTATTRLVTGLPFLDQATTGGGLPRGAITELISPRTSAGSASLTNALIHGANRDNYFVALIDGRDSFDPCVPGRIAQNFANELVSLATAGRINPCGMSGPYPI